MKNKYRDLDAKIAKEILNYRYIKIGGDYNGENSCEILFSPDEEATQDYYNMLPLVGKPHEAFFVPKYSENIQLGLQLAKKVGYNKHLTLQDLPLDSFLLAEEVYDFWNRDRKNDPN